MSGAGGKWMVSSVTEGHIKKLRKARGSKKGKTRPPDYSTNADDGGEEW